LSLLLGHPSHRLCMKTMKNDILVVLHTIHPNVQLNNTDYALDALADIMVGGSEPSLLREIVSVLGLWELRLPLIKCRAIYTYIQMRVRYIIIYTDILNTHKTNSYRHCE
jgi:hypothetical protein